MDFKDYYQILGVPQDADEKTIRAAYRRLARQYHPDVNPGNQEAEERFKEINEANQVLADPEQRKKYDELRAQYQRFQQSGGRPQEFDWQRWAGQPGGGGGVRVEYGSPEDFADLFGDESPFSDFFTSIFGQAQARGPAQGRGPASRPRRGRDVEYPIDITLEEAFAGSSRLLQIGERRIEADIPRGVRTGSRVRLAGQGEPGWNGGPPGDLYLITNVLPHPSFEREGDDLYTDAPVNIYTGVLGGEVPVPTLERPVMLRIPAQTQAGRSFRLRGKGMPRLSNPDRRGDLYARVRLVLPERMTEDELAAFRELAARRETAREAGRTSG
jgi:curved DNA-binding protein